MGIANLCDQQLNKTFENYDELSIMHSLNHVFYDRYLTVGIEIHVFYECILLLHFTEKHVVS